MRESWYLMLFVVLILLVSSLYSEDAASRDPGCYRIPSQTWCANLTSCKCKMNKTDALAYCCNITSSDELKDSFRCADISSATALHILNSNLPRLDASVFQSFTQLNSLSITDNVIFQLYGQFKKQESTLTCLNISSNAITEIDPTALQLLHKVQMLDMSHNNFSEIPKLSTQLSILRLDISDNLLLECKKLIQFTQFLKEVNLENDLTFLNKKNTTCYVPNPWNWKHIIKNRLIPLAAVEKIKEIDQDCPKLSNGRNCDCSVVSLDMAADNKIVYQAAVDCSNREITSLPKVLPLNTKFLNISCNNITSLDGIGNDTYSTIQELYADNNKISSMRPLEGSQFLYNFNILSLKENHIGMLQAYMLSNVFDRNLGKKIFLANNHLMCDCNTAQHIKIWLIVNRAHIPDNDELWCTNLHNTKVVELDHHMVCFTPTHWTDYIHYIIGLEIILFLLLITKVSYDYYVFKTAGYLPWPASQMPKLPCDWCFET